VLVLIGDRVVTPTGERPAAVAVHDGRIVFVGDPSDAPAASTVVQLADDEVLLPGLVDSHVHLQEPGRPGWEGAETATRAAALGGVTTLVDMPLDSQPVTVDLPSLRAKQHALKGRCEVDVGLWGGLVPGLAGLRALSTAGVLGFKAFLSPSGCDHFAPLRPYDLVDALTRLQSSGLPLLVHAEDESQALPLVGPTRRYTDYLASRPAAVEADAVAMLLEAVRATRGRAHVVHVSSAESVALLREAQREGLAVTAETCPHYLALSAELLPDGVTQAKALPAVRGSADADALWAGLAEGVLGLVVSDHSPCAPGGKSTGDFAVDAPGVSSLQLRLPVLWTEARRRGHVLVDVMRWAAEAPATLAGLPTKGRIAVGADADLCVFAPDASLVVEGLAHRQPGSPYDGQCLHGVVRSTWVRGERCEEGRWRGRLLSR
jgi:allantoinase